VTLSIDLPEAVLARLRAEADRRGVGIETVIAELADQLPVVAPAAAPRRLAFVGAGASERGVTARIDQLLADGIGSD
jgi:hypothetical protein